jgi:hypothetical protein
MQAHAERNFVAAERLSIWWAALALFSGPVLNRPTRFGYVPALDVSTAIDAISGLYSRSRWCEWFEVSSECGVVAMPGWNVHRGDTDQWISSQERCKLTPYSSVRITPYDPTQVFRMLIAGCDYYIDGEACAARHPQAIESLHAALGSIGLFCVLTLQASEQGALLLGVDKFPTVSRYPALSASLHRSLARYLRATPS